MNSKALIVVVILGFLLISAGAVETESSSERPWRPDNGDDDDDTTTDTTDITSEEGDMSISLTKMYQDENGNWIEVQSIYQPFSAWGLLTNLADVGVRFKVALDVSGEIWDVTIKYSLEVNYVIIYIPDDASSFGGAINRQFLIDELKTRNVYGSSDFSHNLGAFSHGVTTKATPLVDIGSSILNKAFGDWALEFANFPVIGDEEIGYSTLVDIDPSYFYFIVGVRATIRDVDYVSHKGTDRYGVSQSMTTEYEMQVKPEAPPDDGDDSGEGDPKFSTTFNIFMTGNEDAVRERYFREFVIAMGLGLVIIVPVAMHYIEKGGYINGKNRKRR